MKKNGKKRSLGPMIAILVVALIAVIAVIFWKQYEYAASDNFYEGLRGAMTGGGMRIC